MLYYRGRLIAEEFLELPDRVGRVDPTRFAIAFGGSANAQA